MMRRIYLFAVVIINLQACAVHYYSPKTKTEHLWGFGHMKMKAAASNEGIKSVMFSTSVLGLGVSKMDSRFSFVTGWEQQQRLEVIDESMAVRFEWPKNDLFNVRIGTNIPHLTDPYLKGEK